MLGRGAPKSQNPLPSPTQVPMQAQTCTPQSPRPKTHFARAAEDFAAAARAAARLSAATAPDSSSSEPESGPASAPASEPRSACCAAASAAARLAFSLLRAARALAFCFLDGAGALPAWRGGATGPAPASSRCSGGGAPLPASPPPGSASPNEASEGGSPSGSEPVSRASPCASEAVAGPSPARGVAAGAWASKRYTVTRILATRLVSENVGRRAMKGRLLRKVAGLPRRLCMHARGVWAPAGHVRPRNNQSPAGSDAQHSPRAHARTRTRRARPCAPDAGVAWRQHAGQVRVAHQAPPV